MKKVSVHQEHIIIINMYILNEKVKVSCSVVSNSLQATTWCTVHGIFQARILEWVDFAFSRGSSPPRDQTQVSRIADGFFTI